MQNQLISHMSLLSYTPTPIQEIVHPIAEQAGVRLFVKREDLNHSTVSGNKWWKLKYNLDEAVQQAKPILTFGGAYSNHIFSTAAAAHQLGLRSIGVIRGERISPLNTTLQFAEDRGMYLHFVDRSRYRDKTSPAFLEEMKKLFGDCFIIPEGGTNQLALKGTSTFAKDYLRKIGFDYLMMPVGTGGTMAGIICGLEGSKAIIGVSVLKNGDFLRDEVRTLIENFSGTPYGNWDILTSYDHGGYAKVNKTLVEFIGAMNDQHNLPLDAVYTGKLMWAVLKEIEERRFPKGSTVLALHTGGLQNLY